MVDKDEERTHISNVLQANGYPHSLIENNSRLPSRLHQTDESTNRTQPKATVVIPYIKLKEFEEFYQKLILELALSRIKPSGSCWFIPKIRYHCLEKLELCTKWIVVHAGAHTWDKLEGHSSTE